MSAEDTVPEEGKRTREGAVAEEVPHGLQDTILEARLCQIVDEHNIKVIIETGVDKGLSTVKFARMVSTVFAVDNCIDCFFHLETNLQKRGVKNVVPCLGSSPTVLRALAPILPDETLYFLDAHWQDYWPVLDEIKAIRRGTGVIVLHDMQVPGHPEFPWRFFKHPLNYAYVAEELRKWSPAHRIEYNDACEGCAEPRGVGYVFPK